MAGGMSKAIDAWHKRCNPLTSDALRELDRRSAAATFSGHLIPSYDRGRRDAYLDVSDHIPHREHKLTGHERDWIIARANRFTLSGTEYGHGRSDGYIDSLDRLTLQNPIDPVSGAGFVAGQIVASRVLGNPLGEGAKVRIRGLVKEMKKRASGAHRRHNLGLANWYRGQLAAYAVMLESDGFTRPLQGAMRTRLRRRNPEPLKVGDLVYLKRTGEEAHIRGIETQPGGFFTKGDVRYIIERKTDKGLVKDGVLPDQITR